MALSKDWMEIEDRSNLEYVRGVDLFLVFAYNNSGSENTILCPCQMCRNTVFKNRSEVRIDLLKNGITRSYRTWFFHGEKEPDLIESDYEDSQDLPQDDFLGLLNDVFRSQWSNEQSEPEGYGEPQEHSEPQEHNEPEEPNPETLKFYNLLRDAQEELYPGCEYSRLGAIIKLLHLKSTFRWTNTSFDALLEILRGLVPNGKKKIPESFRHATKYIGELGLECEKIDSCYNDCILYWDKYANAIVCPTCGLSRWKFSKDFDTSAKGKNVPHKVLRYFPLKQRLQRLYNSTKIASSMRWHKEGRIDNEVMSHPADSIAWKHFDDQHKEFAKDLRNVRLGLATDGFQPFGKMASQYSIWPVVLIPYNQPPWICMKESSFLLSLLIPGPNGPGMNIDVYLQPLIKELRELWDVGILTYDAHAKQNFQLHAALLWTFSDFPAYAELSGWRTQGYLACPSCHKDTESLRLDGSSKLCYMGHRRFLPQNHKWRRNMVAFNGKKEERSQPISLDGDEVLKEVSFFGQQSFGRGTKRKYGARDKTYNWRKKSIFFDLPYWRTLKLRHNLDVMHVEKNICDNVLGTIMNIKGKTKDTLKSRYDLVQLGIRPELHPSFDGHMVKMPAACYTLSEEERKAVLKVLVDLKTPDGYMSNISRCVNEKKLNLSSMKSHDYHIFLQQLLPLAIPGYLPKKACDPLVELSCFFKDLCSKNLKLDELDLLEKQIVVTLCKLEMVFPPSFFDVMVHLAVHLPHEAKLAGPVQYRWMYRVERFWNTLGSYIGNKAHPEGSIAKGYLVEECLTFCSRYLEGIDTKFNRPARNDDHYGQPLEGSLDVFSLIGRPLGAHVLHSLSFEEKEQAHLYILNNYGAILPFIEEFNMMEDARRKNLELQEWLYQHVALLHSQGVVNANLLHLVQGPIGLARVYTGYVINGFRFHTFDRENFRKSQNSGVMVTGDNNSLEKEYYGFLTEVCELHYVGGNRVVLFRCEWYDVQHLGLGYKIDRYGIISVNAERRLKTIEPFVLASQATQVFYVEDPKNPSWRVVVKTVPRDLYRLFQNSSSVVNEDELVADHAAFQQNEPNLYDRVAQTLDDNDEITTLQRANVVAEEVSTEVAQKIEQKIMNKRGDLEVDEQSSETVETDSDTSEN